MKKKIKKPKFAPLVIKNGLADGGNLIIKKPSPLQSRIDELEKRLKEYASRYDEDLALELKVLKQIKQYKD